MGAAVWGTRLGVEGMLERGFVRHVVSLGAGVVVGAVVFGVVALVLRIPELQMLVGAVRRRGRA